MVRAFVAAGVLAVAAAASSAATPRLHFPRDHFGHPNAGIEWWYFTGVVQGADGHRYSVFFTVFSRAGYVLPISQVIDLDTGAVVGHTETLAKAKVAASKVDVSVEGARLRYQRGTNTWRASASQSGYALSLVATPQKPYVLEGGGTGFIQTPAGPSAYYSSTRMTARGTITAGGAPPVSFTGTAWLDHQWGNFAGDPSALNWDWFSCRFDDRTELMLYRFRDRDGTPLITARNVTYVLRNGHSMTASTSFILPATESALEAAGHRWPLGWKLLVPSLGLAETVSAIVPDQLFRGTLVPTFYEGAATASGNENGQLKTGTCFVEETYG